MRESRQESSDDGEGDSRMMVVSSAERNRSILKWGDSPHRHVEECHPHIPTAIVPSFQPEDRMPMWACSRCLCHVWMKFVLPLLACHPNPLRSTMMRIETENKGQPPVSGQCLPDVPVPVPDYSPAWQWEPSISKDRLVSLSSGFSSRGTCDVSG